LKRESPDNDNLQPDSFSIAENISSPSSLPDHSSEEGSKPETLPSSFKVLDTSTGKLLNLSRKDFLYGAVAAEMPPLYNIEALKAQAVASLSYYTTKQAEETAAPTPALKGADFECSTDDWMVYTDTTHMKERWGISYDDYFARITQAVDAVIDVMITYEGEPIVAAYHAISGGRTEDSGKLWGTQLKYLSAVESPGDLLSPEYETKKEVSAAEFRETIKGEYTDAVLDGSPEGWFKASSKTDSGTVTSIVIGGLDITGQKIRELFSLRSANFDLSYSSDIFTFTVRGYGHCVGMSQYGANEMAAQGSTYKEILSWYYKGTEIS
jgi:stage II sporulation protein D